RLRPTHSSLRLADVHLQRADTIDAAFELVAGLQLRDAGRRARHDDVARGELHLLGQLPDDFGHVPDQFGKVALLGLLAVHRQPDLAVRRVADPGSGLDRRAGRGIVERLADLPRPFLLARGDLQIAAGEVNADGIAVDMLERLVGRDVEAAALHGDDQLD